jgi:hypothetical protein
MRVCTGGLQVLCKPLPHERLDDLKLAVERNGTVSTWPVSAAAAVCSWSQRF